MSKEIILEFLNGKSTITVNGVKGKACKELTAKLEEALGKVEKTTLTDEYKEKEEIRAVHRVSQ